MKIKPLILVSALLLISLPLFSEDIEKNIIINSMEFPEPDLKIGNMINEPLFAVNIQKKIIDTAEIRKNILNIEKELNDKSDPDKYYELGSNYYNLLNNDLAIKYYKKYLEASLPEYDISKEEFKTIVIKGDIYYALSEIDLKSDKIDNLEKSLIFMTKAIELNPENLKIWINLGDCYLSLGKTTEALYCYNKILEKNPIDFTIYARLQAAAFQRDYLKLSDSKSDDKIENQVITQGFDFEYIQTAINNSPVEFKDSLKLQHYIYLIRLMLVKKEYFFIKNQNETLNLTAIFTNDEIAILDEVDQFLKSTNNKKIRNLNFKYISGILSFLKSDYKKAVTDFKEILNDGENPEFIHNEILSISLYFTKDNNEVKKTIEDITKKNPASEDYLILANLEFRNKNLNKAEMLCQQSLKINTSYPEAYSGIAVINAIKGNYIAADEMIKKANFLIHKDNSKKNLLLNQMKVNEAAIALLKNEKERAYILLRSVLSADNNEKANLLYNRYFIKNEKIQN